MQLAIARAYVALDAAIVQDVPIAPQFALDGLIYVALGLSFSDTFKMVVRRERGKMQASLQSMTTRPAAVAGQFYAGDPDQLRTQILQLFADSSRLRTSDPKP